MKLVSEGFATSGSISLKPYQSLFSDETIEQYNEGQTISGKLKRYVRLFTE